MTAEQRDKVPDVVRDEQNSRRPVYLHWVPENELTACDMNIDFPKALAWTIIPDWEWYKRSNDGWPPACPVCVTAAEQRKSQ